MLNKILENSNLKVNPIKNLAKLYLVLFTIKNIIIDKMNRIEQLLLNKITNKMDFPEFAIQPISPKPIIKINVEKLWKFLKNKNRMDDFFKVVSIKPFNLRKLDDGNNLLTAFQTTIGFTEPGIQIIDK